MQLGSQFIQLTIGSEMEDGQERSSVGDTKPDLLQTARRLLPPERRGHVRQVERSLVEVAVVEVVFGLKTFLKYITSILCSKQANTDLNALSSNGVLHQHFQRTEHFVISSCFNRDYAPLTSASSVCLPHLTCHCTPCINRKNV